ncbi:MAG: hypothetical protein HY721_30805 [Planctomycetes bacterium]|nr:hypothetical protein [Planctomycetota bacterium]
MGLFDKGPGYTGKDLVFYVGLIGGIIIVYLALQPYGFHPFVALLCGIAVGGGAGWVLEKVWDSVHRSGRGPGPGTGPGGQDRRPG